MDGLPRIVARQIILVISMKVAVKRTGIVEEDWYVEPVVLQNSRIQEPANAAFDVC